MIFRGEASLLFSNGNQTSLYGYKRVMGLDEVGRGCLSGPVVAAGVIINPEHKIKHLRDSKTISKKERESLAETIKVKAEYWTIQQCNPAEIDRLNILKASIQAMLRCTEMEDANPDFLLVDGNRFTSSLIPHKCLVKGDDRSASIAAASVLAKVHRDEIMRNLHDDYPFYGWDTNVGYPTRVHYEGLMNYGYTKHHRKSFNLRTKRLYQPENE